MLFLVLFVFYFKLRKLKLECLSQGAVGALAVHSRDGAPEGARGLATRREGTANVKYTDIDQTTKTQKTRKPQKNKPFQKVSKLRSFSIDLNTYELRHTQRV